MIVIQNCPRASGLIWLWHTHCRWLPDLRRTWSESHTSLVMFFQQSQQWNTFLHRMWSDKLAQTKVILYLWQCGPARPQNSTRHGGWPGFTLWTTRQLMSTGQVHTFITVIKLTGAQSEPGQSWTYGYKHCNELVFHTWVHILLLSNLFSFPV